MVEGRTVPPGSSEEVVAACAHHWRIEPPAGETSRGVCQLCGASRDFLNYGYKPAMSRNIRSSSSQANAPPKA